MAAQITTIPLSEIRARPQVRSEHNQGFKLYLNKDKKIHIAIRLFHLLSLLDQEVCRILSL